MFGALEISKEYVTIQVVASAKNGIITCFINELQFFKPNQRDFRAKP